MTHDTVLSQSGNVFLPGMTAADPHSDVFISYQAKTQGTGLCWALAVDLGQVPLAGES